MEANVKNAIISLKSKDKRIAQKQTGLFYNSEKQRLSEQ